MMAIQWRTGCICIAILGAIISLAFGGTGEIIIPGCVVLVALITLGKKENINLYVLAAGQLLVYGAAQDPISRLSSAKSVFLLRLPGIPE